MGWKSLDIAADAVARGTAAALKASFETAFAKAGAPRNAALFEVPRPDGVRFYFSPGAVNVFDAALKTMALTPAGAPPDDARLAVGHAATWNRRP